MSLPPGPRLPPAAQTLAWVSSPVAFMEACRRRFGDVFTIRLAQVGTLVFVSDPDAIRSIFTADPRTLRAGAANSALEPVLGGRSVLLLDADEHLRARRLMLPPFHGERMSGYEQLMSEIAERALATWPVAERFPLQPRMQAITLEVIVRIVFGVRDGPALQRVRAALLDLLAAGTRKAVMLPWLRRDLGPGSPWRRFAATRERVDSVIYAEIARRRGERDLGERDDILSLLLQARDEDGRGLSDGELRDQLVTLLVAGHETTATALSWGFERLLRHPVALERAVAAARGEGEPEDGWLEAVVTETLRLRPPLPLVARYVARPWELAGRDLPVGVVVAPCIHLVHRRPDVYPDPEEFRPERFLDRSPGTYTWLPFGGGRRRCLGASFALFEMRVVLRTVLARARLRVADPDPEPVRRRAIVLAPGRGGRVVLTERSPAGASLASKPTASAGVSAARGA